VGTQSVKRMSIGDALERGMAHHHGGQLREAEAWYRKVLEVRPDNPDAQHLLGVIARQSGRPDVAVGLIERAIALNGGNPTYHANLGTALEALGKRDDAIAAYRRALEIKSDYPEALFELGAALEMDGQIAEAATCFARAVAVKPDFVEAHYRQGVVLRLLGRTKEAVAAEQRVLALQPDHAEAHVEIGRGLRNLGRLDDAVAALQRAAEIKPDLDDALFHLSIALLERGDPHAVLAECDAHLERRPGTVRMLALKAIVLNDLGMTEALDSLCGYDRFVRPKKFEAPDGYANMEAFNDEFGRYVCAHPTLEFERRGHATRFGGHTGDLLINAAGPAAAFEKMVRATVEDYMRTLPDDPSHPFLATRPDAWRLTAWAVVMETRGHQLPHLHPAAWLSGVYYVMVPEATRSTESMEGWIEFGKPEPTLRCKVTPEVRRYQPEEGLMLLFPSYLYHHTVPFETAEKRISIAFDVIPEG